MSNAKSIRSHLTTRHRTKQTLVEPCQLGRWMRSSNHVVKGWWGFNRRIYKIMIDISLDILRWGGSNCHTGHISDVKALSLTPECHSLTEDNVVLLALQEHLWLLHTKCMPFNSEVFWGMATTSSVTSGYWTISLCQIYKQIFIVLCLAMWLPAIRAGERMCGSAGEDGWGQPGQECESGASLLHPRSNPLNSTTRKATI